MSSDERSPGRLDELAAVVARQTLDLNVYAGFLLDTLGDALPAEYVMVQRSGSLWRRRDAPIVAVSVSLGEQRFTLRRASVTAVPEPSISHQVGGITLKSEVVALSEWAHRLAAGLAELAARNADAAAALARITSMEV
ncbi:MAG TPA: hypothetical protein VGJ59_00780 [Jatrophihabitantaceae bacterium]|jgi:hypothetical protein